MNEVTPHRIPRAVSPSRTATSFAPPTIDLVNEVEKNEGIGLRDYWGVIRRYIRIIIGSVFAAVFTAGVVLLSMTPVFTATATLLIEPRVPRIVEIQQVLAEPLQADEDDYFKTQYEILKSRSLAAQVIQDQNLGNNDLFAGTDKEQGVVAAFWSDVKTWVTEQTSRFFPQVPRGKPGNTLGGNSRATNTYLKALEVSPIKGTRLVNIAFSTPDPELSARIANAHAETYIRQGLSLRTSANQQAQKFLEDKLVELRARVESSEDALNSYRRGKGILSLDDKENIVVERLADLNKRLTEAEAERIGLEAHYRLIRMRDYDSLPAVINSVLIQNLKAQAVQLEGEVANLSSQFKAGYPKLAQVKAQLQETQLRLQQEVQKVVAGIESVYLAASAKEKGLRANMEAQKAAAMHLKDAAVHYAILSREVNTNKQLYDSVLERMKEVGVAAEIRASNIFVIDAAEPPLAPAHPKKRTALLFSALVGLLGGLGLAFFLKYLDNTFQTPEEAERYLGLPNLGLVPAFPKTHRRFLERAPGIGRRSLRKHGHRLPASEMVFYPDEPEERPELPSYPFGPVNEAYRTLRTGILLSEAEEPPKTVLFTSAIHGEGKTATVVNSAVTFAQMGVKVLLIDADLRRPMCHKILGMRKGLGLGELLSGRIKPAWAIQPTHVHNLFFISCGSSSPIPTELLGSKKMCQILALARQHYDYILIDSPPVMAVSDSVLLSTMVDGVVLVVGGQDTPRHVVKQGCARLRYAHANILGMVLNRIKPDRDGYRVYYSYSEAMVKEA
jgi:capsular exopolysaccharide synthesis family protein